MNAWDVVVVGAGPAGCAAALGALAERPGARVLLLDRSDFPRDKPCGDGVAPHVLDVLAGVGVTGLLADRVPVEELELRRGDAVVRRPMCRPAWVVPRAVLDERLVRAAVAAGAVLRRRRVREVRVGRGRVVVDGEITAPALVGADGAHSVVRAALGLPRGRRALALRGYAPTGSRAAGRQVIAFGTARQPSYAWAFDRGDGWANVGYGQGLSPGSTTPTRHALLAELEHLLPGVSAGGQAWRGHHLPLSTWRFQQPDGPVLLAGDAAGLVNPMTGEGIYDAVATGVLAGRAAVTRARAAGGPGAAYRRDVRRLLGRHQRHTALGAALAAAPLVVPAALRAAAHHAGVFDDLVEVGLAGGTLTPRVIGRTVTHLRG